MSQLEIARTNSPVYVYTMPVLVGGTVTTTNVALTYNTSPLFNFRPACSKIVGIELVTAGGTPGATPPMLTVSSVINSTADGYLPQILLRSSNNLDTSVYAIYWVNEVASSPYQTVTIC
jgi:hypothetical protein